MDKQTESQIKKLEADVDRLQKVVSLLLRRVDRAEKTTAKLTLAAERAQNQLNALSRRRE